MSWRDELKRNFTSTEQLAEFLELSALQRAELVKKPGFPLNVPFRLAAKMAKGSLEDPLFLQFVAMQSEEVAIPGFVEDPVEDLCFSKGGRMLQKYSGRALLVTTGYCAMNCRFCFRRNFPYASGTTDFGAEIENLKQDASIDELILSGGDPLSLSNRALKELFDKLEEIPHLTRVRFHTRFPIGIPSRIDEEFLELLRNCSKTIWFVLHTNHPLELDEELFQKIQEVRKAQAVVLTQTVLLKGVNDSEETLEMLCRKLINQGVIPYYLHQLDRVQGAHLFEVPLERGFQLIRHLEKTLPGYGVPKYVREIPHKQGKTVLHPL